MVGRPGLDAWTSHDLRHQPCHDGEIYDPENGTWNAAPSMKAHHSSLLSLPSGKVLAFGNYSCELYDPIANDWIGTGSMFNQYHGDCAATLNDRSVLSSAGSSWEMYNPHTGAWGIPSPLPHPDQHVLCVLAALPSGHALAMGGVLNGWLKNTCLGYDPAQDSWSPAAAMNVARMLFSVTVLKSGQVVVVHQSFRASPIQRYVPPPIELKKTPRHRRVIRAGSIGASSGPIASLLPNFADSRCRSTSKLQQRSNRTRVLTLTSQTIQRTGQRC